MPPVKKKLGVIKEVNKKQEKLKVEVIKDPMFVGLDPSYNGFGAIMLNEKAEIMEQRLITSSSKDEVEDRIISMENEFKFIPTVQTLFHVYIEGPSYSSKGAFMLQMGALHYYLRIFFRKHNVRYIVKTPNELKKYITGKGNCQKDLILLKVYKKWGIEFSDHNLADAYVLARMALEDYKNTME